MPKEGTWGFSSKSDPRWDCSGRAFWDTMSMAPEATTKLNSLKLILGEPPADLYYSFWKD